MQYVFDGAVTVSDRLYVVSPAAESTDLLRTHLRWLNIPSIGYRLQPLFRYWVYLRCQSKRVQQWVIQKSVPEYQRHRLL